MGLAPQWRAIFQQFFDICASRYSGVQFFHIPTSKNGPSMWCFVHFDLQMCFWLQQRAIFPHPNFKMWSGAGVFCTFLLATAACNFSTLNFERVRSWCVLCILTCKCASRYSMQFFLSPVNSYFRTRRFTEVTFRPSRPTNH